MTKILIADDQRDVLEALRILLKGEGYQTEAVTSLAGIFNALEKKEYALLLMDLNYARDSSGQEGLSAIPKIRLIDNTLPVVVMTAWATVELAVEAMKRGARDFVTKPWDNQPLLTIVRTQIELARTTETYGGSDFLLPGLCCRFCAAERREATAASRADRIYFF